ncbi:hypothetical protein VSU19_19770 [Verrucomicrobiales bacterium BCK34]|nr:hypothetical protein [Verrucomicrobiales bacterium BCK34]
MPDTVPDPRFPVPNSQSTPATSSDQAQYFREIDISKTRFVMHDGRPALVENWFDCDTEFYCRTVRYTAFEAEDWDGNQHYQFVKKSGLLEDQTYRGTSAGTSQTTDDAGLSWWVVTVPIRKEED